MEKYINQLLQDLERKIVKRWNEQVPHFYNSGQMVEYLTPPKGWNQGKHEYFKKETLEPLFEDKIRELENWLDQADQHSMFYKFELSPQQFPPAEQLTDEQLDVLVRKILRLWAAYNLGFSPETNVPRRYFYPVILNRMLKPTSFVNHGVIGIEFCYYEPNDCPFPSEYCSCKDFDYESLN